MMREHWRLYWRHAHHSRFWDWVGVSNSYLDKSSNYTLLCQLESSTTEEKYIHLRERGDNCKEMALSRDPVLCYSKHGPRTGSFGTTQEVDRNIVSVALLRHTESYSLF